MSAVARLLGASAPSVHRRRQQSFRGQCAQMKTTRCSLHAPTLGTGHPDPPNWPSIGHIPPRAAP
eukprot:4953355-Prymnesium_polylepis.1